MIIHCKIKDACTKEFKKIVLACTQDGKYVLQKKYNMT